MKDAKVWALIFFESHTQRIGQAIFKISVYMNFTAKMGKSSLPSSLSRETNIFC